MTYNSCNSKIVRFRKNCRIKEMKKPKSKHFKYKDITLSLKKKIILRGTKLTKIFYLLNLFRK